jgi:hypothetical protein
MALPFSRAAFLHLLEQFNLAWWPVLVVLFAVSVWAIVAIARSRANGRWITVLLAAHWLWSGVVFHLAYFTGINPAAYVFGAGFVVQGLLFLTAAVRAPLAFAWNVSLRQFAGLAFLAASVLYPLLVLLAGDLFPAAPAFGVPCPTLLFTTGALLCATTKVPRAWLVVPIAWSAIGGSASLFLGVTPDLLLFAAGAALTVLALPSSIHLSIERWFERDDQVQRPLRGDALVPAPCYAMTLTRVVHAGPQHVWPWLVQMGRGRGGLYSYDLLDRLFGYLDAPSATTVLPRYQQLQPGDEIPIGKGGNFPVRIVDPPRSLVLGGSQQGFAWSWEFALDQVDATHTRIISRNRGNTAQTLGARLFMPLLGVAAFLMTRRMLIGVAERAERLAGLDARRAA